MTTTVTTPIAFIKATFSGRDGAGAISVPGLKVGDAVILNSINNRENNFAFESFITTDDQIYQWATDNLEFDMVTLVVMRGV